VAIDTLPVLGWSISLLDKVKGIINQTNSLTHVFAEGSGST